MVQPSEPGEETETQVVNHLTTPPSVLEPSRQKTETKLFPSSPSFFSSLSPFALSPSLPPSLSLSFPPFLLLSFLSPLLSYQVNKYKGIKVIFVGETLGKSR